ncbi:MAG TPA: hypothetical protein VD927_13200 [Chryseosolibacter sp.]|nr:hypothetical protein [Chryseosolibacter sp.]
MSNSSSNQVAAFGKLVGICNDLGASYNPSRVSLKTTALATLLKQAQQSSEAVIVAQQNYALRVNERVESFKGIPKLAARIVRAASASGVSAENLKDISSLKFMIQKGRVSKRPLLKTVDGEPAKHFSARFDYETRVEFLARLIQTVSALPGYAPNETDLKVPSLKTFLAGLRTKNEQVAKAASTLERARRNRRKHLYSSTGIYGIASAVKNYIRSIEGVRSEMSGTVSNLRFTE